jgi:hypothetical protein
MRNHNSRTLRTRIFSWLWPANFSLPSPGFLAAINPIVGLVGGTEGLAIVPQTMFDSFASGTQWFQASNVFVWAALQWLGLGLVIDLVRKRA